MVVDSFTLFNYFFQCHGKTIACSKMWRKLEVETG